MSFGENIVYYRKQSGITQEELAERLYVSRQTVSRWENSSAFPDVEMLIRLCDIFNCDMDTLVRGDAEKKNSEKLKFSTTESEIDIAKYDKHMNLFALLISLGVWLIIFAVSLTVFTSGFNGGELISVIVLFALLSISVADFIFCGINHTNFMRENPRMPSYPEEKIKAFLKKMPWFIITATVLIFIGVILLIIMNYDENSIPVDVEKNFWEHLSAAIFLSIISVSTFLYVYSGIIYSKFNVKEYNDACISEGFIASDESENGLDEKKKRLNDSISSIIMLSATAIFLLLGFLKNLWHPAWVAFPIGGICCGICSVILDIVFRGSKK